MSISAETSESPSPKRSPIAARPTDPMNAKLARLGKMTRRITRLNQPVDVRLGQRVELPSEWVEQPHYGTVTRVTDTQFRVTWHGSRPSGRPRQRFWYSRYTGLGNMRVIG